MAAGLIMVAHKSGGPMMDIVETLEPSRTGFLATTEAEYAQTIAHILKLSPESRTAIQARARASVHRFSEENFIKDFLGALKPVLE
jgi:alpha-1,2-mannosyltransferase